MDNIKKNLTLLSALAILIFCLLPFVEMFRNNLDFLPNTTGMWENKPFKILAVSSQNIPKSELFKIVKFKILPELLELKCVKKVSTNVKKQNTIIYLDPDKLDSHGITAIDIVSQVPKYYQNLQIGSLQEFGLNSSVSAIGIKHGETLASLAIRLYDGDKVALGDFARVETNDQTEEINFPLNRNAVIIYIYRNSDVKPILADEMTKDKVSELQNRLPVSMQISQIPSPVGGLKNCINISMLTTIVCFIVSTLVLIYFFNDVFSVGILEICLLVAIGGTGVVVHFAKYSLNSVTFSAFASFLLLGTLDILLFFQDKYSKKLFCYFVGLGSIFIVLYPLILTQGFSGECLKHFSLVALTASIFLLIEIYAVQLLFPLKSPKRHLKIFQFNILSAVLSKTGLFFSILVLLLGGYFVTFYSAPEFLPDLNKNIWDISLNLADNTPKDTVDDVQRHVYKVLRRATGIKYFYAFINSDNKSYIRVITAEETKNLDALKASLRNSLKKFAGANFSLDSINFPDISAPDVILTLTGNDFQSLESYSQKITKEIYKIHGVTDINTQIFLQTPRLDFVVDNTRAQELGVRTDDVAEILRAALSGKVISVNYSQSVSIEFEPSIKNDLNAIKSLKAPAYDNFGSFAGYGIPIDNVCKIKLSVDSPKNKKVSKIQANLSNISLLEFDRRLNSISLFKKPPSGIKIFYEGKMKYMKEFLHNVIQSFIISLILLAIAITLFALNWGYVLFILSAFTAVCAIAVVFDILCGQKLDIFAYFSIITAFIIILKLVINQIVTELFAHK